MRGMPREKSTQWLSRRVSQMVRDADMHGHSTYVKFSAANAFRHVQQQKRHDGRGRIIAVEGQAIGDGFAVAE